MRSCWSEDLLSDLAASFQGRDRLLGEVGSFGPLTVGNVLVEQHLPLECLNFLRWQLGRMRTRPATIWHCLDLGLGRRHWLYSSRCLIVLMDDDWLSGGSLLTGGLSLRDSTTWALDPSSLL